MTTYLTIDEGNSSTKVALWRNGVMEAVSTHRQASVGMVSDILPAGETADAAIVCSVCRPDRERLTAALEPYARRLIVLDATTPMPIQIAYRTPSTLGPDRIAAAAGAHALFPNRTMLVVDMGTAITYDVITADGRYLGGNIAPGIFVRLEALNHFTSALPMIETDGPVPRWGHDTETAMRSGAIRGVVGEMQYYRHCLLAHNPRAGVVLTGGSADLILPHISSRVAVEPNLVLIGLSAILQYNLTSALT